MYNYAKNFLAAFTLVHIFFLNLLLRKKKYIKPYRSKTNF